MKTTEMEKQEDRTIEDIEKEIEILKKWGHDIPEELLKEKARLEGLSSFEKSVTEIIQELMRKYDVFRDAVIQLKHDGKSSFEYTSGFSGRTIEEINIEIDVLKKYGHGIPESLLEEKTKLQNSESFKEESVFMLIQLMCKLEYYHHVEIDVSKDGNVRVVTIKDEVQKRLDKTKAEKPTHQDFTQPEAFRMQTGRKPPLKFSMIGIKKGETLVFVPTNWNVTVASDDEVSYQGKLYKLTAFVKKFHPNANPSNPGSYRGPNFFTYHGVLLTKIRESLEEKDENGKLAKQRNSTRRIVYNRKNWTKIQRVKVGDEIEGLGVVTERYSKGELYPDSEAAVIINGKKWDNSRIENYFGITRKQRVKQGEKEKRKALLTFSMIGISIGETLVFEPTKLKVKVVSDNEVGYLGKRYRLSAFVKEFYPKEKQRNSGAYQGSRFFSYRGKLLEDIRQEMNV